MASTLGSSRLKALCAGTSAAGWLLCGPALATPPDTDDLTTPAQEPHEAREGSAAASQDGNNLTAYPTLGEAFRSPRSIGFYMQFGLGVGQLQFGAGGTLPQAHGGGPGLTLRLGQVLMDDLVWHGDLVASGATNPRVNVGGESFETEDTSASLVGVGGGLSYYGFPHELFAGASALASWLTIREQGETLAESGIGPALLLRGGKRFLLGPTFGIELSANVHLARLPDDTAAINAVAWGLNIGLSGH